MSARQITDCGAMSKGTTRRRTGSRRRQGPQRGGVNWTLVGGAVGVLVIVIALAINLSRQVGTIEGLRSYGPLAGGIHVTTPVNYPQSPPVGGEHYAAWQNCGIYDQPIQNENAVHSLEHGAVWLTYRPDLPAAEVEQLRNLVRGRSYTLLSPFPNQPTPIAASAWGYQITADSAGDGRLGQFIARFRQGQQAPEQGALCTSGVGSPVEQ
jgi:hypothetical protein